MAGDADVHQHAVKAGHAGLLHDLREVPEISTEGAELRRVGLQPLLGVPQRIRVLVHGHHTCAVLEQRFGMAATAEGAVEDQFSRSRLQKLDDLRQQYRRMVKRHRPGSGPGRVRLGRIHSAASAGACHQHAAAPGHHIIHLIRGAEPRPAAHLGQRNQSRNPANDPPLQ